MSAEIKPPFVPPNIRQGGLSSSFTCCRCKRRIGKIAGRKRAKGGWCCAECVT